MRQDQAHLGYLIVLVHLTANMYVGERHQPAWRHGGGIVGTVHGSAAVVGVERCSEGAVVIGDVDDIRSGGVIEDIIARLDRVAHDVVF